MSIDIHALSSNLLESLANSIHDREGTDKNFCFSASEKHVVELWLLDLVNVICSTEGDLISPQTGATGLEHT